MEYSAYMDKTSSDLVSEIANEILGKLPLNYNIEKVMEKYPFEYKSSNELF